MFKFIKMLLGSKGDNSVQEALDKGAIIIDVRTPAEYSAGHVAGSKNIPLSDISKQIDKIKSFNKPIVLCCASGMRSGQATSILTKSGIEAYNAGSWVNLK